LDGIGRKVAGYGANFPSFNARGSYEQDVKIAGRRWSVKVKQSPYRPGSGP